METSILHVHSTHDGVNCLMQMHYGYCCISYRDLQSNQCIYEFGTTISQYVSQY